MNKKQRKELDKKNRELADKLGMTPNEIEYIQGSRSKLCMNFKHIFALQRDLDDPSTLAYCKMYLSKIRVKRADEESLDKALDQELDAYREAQDNRPDALEEQWNQMWNE
jgi:hypothetical protein